MVPKSQRENSMPSFTWLSCQKSENLTFALFGNKTIIQSKTHLKDLWTYWWIMSKFEVRNITGELWATCTLWVRSSSDVSCLRMLVSGIWGYACPISEANTVWSYPSAVKCFWPHLYFSVVPINYQRTNASLLKIHSSFETQILITNPPCLITKPVCVLCGLAN